MNWLLVVWFLTPENYAVYSEFKSLQQCQEKRIQIDKALAQAESKMKTECREITKLPQA